jgi:peptide/nickel transport system substrate-binding protein
MKNRLAKVMVAGCSSMAAVLLLTAGSSSGVERSSATSPVGGVDHVASVSRNSVGSGSVHSRATSHVAAVCQGTPTPGGTFTMAVQNQTLSLDPYNTPGGFGDGEAQSLIMQGLVELDPTGKSRTIYPAISDSWQISNGGKTYTFHIRSGVTFSNGQPITATDIQSALNDWANPKVDEYASSFSQGYVSTTVLSSSEVQVNLSTPVGGLLYYLAMPPAAIYPASLAQSQGAAFWNNPVGSGPFTLQSWVKGSSITFVKNPTFWNTGHPLLNKVVFNFVTDANTRLLDLESGQAQVIDSVPFDQVSSLKAHKNLTVTPYKIPSWVLLSLNNKKAPFNNVKVRNALSDAIDRNLLNKEVYGGLATVPNSVLPQLQLDGTNHQVPADKFNLKKAKQLMSSAGKSKGFSATLQYPNGDPEFASLALVLQQEWMQLGIKLTLRSEDQATLSKNFTSGAYDMIMPYALAVSDVVIPDEFASLYAIPSATHGFFSWWSNATIAAMVKKLDHGPVAQRAALWLKIQAAMQAQQPVLNVLDLPFVEGLQTNICSNNLTPIGYESLINTWIGQ